MKYYIKISCYSAGENDLSADVTRTLQRSYEGKIIEDASFKGMLSSVQDSIRELNRKHGRCKPVKDVSLITTDAPRIYVTGNRNFSATISFLPITGTLVL